MHSASKLNLASCHIPNPFLLVGSTQSGPGVQWFAATLFFHFLSFVLSSSNADSSSNAGAQRVRTQAFHKNEQFGGLTLGPGRGVKQTSVVMALSRRPAELGAV